MQHIRGDYGNPRAFTFTAFNDSFLFSRRSIMLCLRSGSLGRIICAHYYGAADISVARVLFTKRHGAEEPECHPQILKNSNRLNMLLGLLDLPAAKTTRSDAGPSGT
ncbi:hypothetical protein Bbelb_201300 [Branchiostoma belcheri]|nr:hypothetical protein Bbelb_201300 [Branchiostoma belcheri]